MFYIIILSYIYVVVSDRGNLLKYIFHVILNIVTLLLIYTLFGHMISNKKKKNIFFLSNDD